MDYRATGMVFALVAAMTTTPLVLVLLIPCHPEKGRERVFSKG